MTKEKNIRAQEETGTREKEAQNNQSKSPIEDWSYPDYGPPRTGCVETSDLVG